MKTPILTILATLISISAYSQANKNFIRHFSSKSFTQLSRKLTSKAITAMQTAQSKNNDLIIGYPDADESSVIFIANTATAVEPEAHRSAIIFEAQCPPVEHWRQPKIWQLC